MNKKFELHPRLQHDCIVIGRFELCQLLLMNDQNYPWFILVPERAGLREYYQLSQTDRGLLMDESCYLAEKLALLYQADKINIAAIGNLVPQLHLHHIVRYQTDAAWPAPVWGFAPAQTYTKQQLEKQWAVLRSGLSRCQFFN